MTIQKLSFIFYLVTAILISLLTLFMGLRYFEQQELEHFQEKRHASFLAADELRQSSDDLTRMARAYVDTGNPKFERMYWEILAIRNGEKERPLHYERSYCAPVRTIGNAHKYLGCTLRTTHNRPHR
jgi:two-component system, sensor histidine kinase and response regulator